MKVFVALALLVLFLFLPCSSDALYLASPSWNYNIANLVKHTDLVVLGKVTGMRLIPQEYSTSITLKVESVIKGDPAVGDRLLRFTVADWAGMKKHRGKRILWSVEGSLKFRLGERLLLFMGGSHGDYRIFRPSGKIMVTDNKVSIPYTYKINRFSDYYNEMRERKVRRFVELPLDLVVKVAKASIKDYDAITAIEVDVAMAVSLAEKEARPSLSVELLKRLEETVDQILEKGANGDERAGTRQLETIEGKNLEPPITVEFDNSVDIPDSNLRAEIERELGRTSIAPITAADMESLTTLYADRAHISDLTGLDAAINLTELRLDANNISDISALSGLTNLTRLMLSHNSLSDISVLSGLTNLTELRLDANNISDISAVSGLTNLTHLSLFDTGISDISAISGLTKLTELELQGNRISDISAVSGLTKLTLLGLWDNTISDLSPLVSNTGFGREVRVSVDGNPLSAVSLNTHIPTRQSKGVNVRVDTPANILDRNLRTKIEAALGTAAGETIKRADMAMLTTLHASFAEISTLTGLEYAINLTHLYLADNRISDISAVSGLTNLTTLYLNRNEISDVSPLSGLTNLTELEFQSNRISDVSALSKLTNLTTLYLNGNKISDISALAGLSNLTHLGLDFNRISDLSPLSGLINLIHLGLGSNRISDLSPLSGLTNLILLGLGVNRISGLSSLSGLTNLIELDLDTNTISDISVLAGLTNLTTGLDLDANSISDLSPLARLTNLTRLELETNSISNLAPLAGLTNLAFLWLDANTISDISVLAGLTNLTGLGLRDNNISDILPLVANTGLKRGDNVYVRDNPLSAKSINTHIPALQSRGVTVHFE